ncbi:hypothetical protein DES53_102933 [Roseimicrobium gellanilyticum]|uniref:Uncharacterized protein n=1 Tax=Roseimicrobium gellanilyticum TaxID=748857 RepID=A0A366HS89_9BACT|nr:hypothetical protein [Roseimicrobium gellanilyticum]RBP46542.1 hypothetical protein DES53_102933 [Roseimicrobium gellanilyticum]
MSSPKTLRWVIAAPCAVGVGVALAFGSWHFRDMDFLKPFRSESASAQAGTATVAAGGGHSGGSPVSSASAEALPSLTQGTLASQERQPTREEFAAILEQEKQKAASEALTSYILSKEGLPKLNQTTNERMQDHPLVEELINKPNAMRGGVAEDVLVPGFYGSGSQRLGGYPQEVLREAAQAFNSPAYAPLRADARAAADMTLGQVSALMNLQEDVQRRLEQGSGGSLGNILGLRNGSGLNLSSGTRRAVGDIVANALGGSGYGSVGGTPFMGNYMTPPVGSPAVAGGVGVDSSEVAAATALVEEYRRLLPDLSEAEMREYLRRVESEGKVAAMQWVVRTKGRR